MRRQAARVTITALLVVSLPGCSAIVPNDGGKSLACSQAATILKEVMEAFGGIGKSDTIDGRGIYRAKVDSLAIQLDEVKGPDQFNSFRGNVSASLHDWSSVGNDAEFGIAVDRIDTVTDVNRKAVAELGAYCGWT